MEKITAIYCRSAYEGPDDLPACHLQATSAIRYAYQNGHRNIRVYSDKGCSGLSLDRPAFREMQAAIQAGRVQTVITKDA